MASAVQNLQNAILSGEKPLSQLLREAKVIAAKLNLNEVETWVDQELNGYSHGGTPPYRNLVSSHVEAHMLTGWRFVSNNVHTFKSAHTIALLEQYAKGEGITINLPSREVVSGAGRHRRKYAQHYRAVICSSEFVRILDAIRNQLLQWTVELQRRGIEGDDMNFGNKEKEAAANQTFNIGNIGSLTGVLGNVTNSQIAIYDYSSVHQMLKDKGVPQAQRNELENLMDELKTASPEKKPSLVQRGKDWITRNKDFLGASTEIVARALGTLPY